MQHVQGGLSRHVDDNLLEEVGQGSAVAVGSLDEGRRSHHLRPSERRRVEGRATTTQQDGLKVRAPHRELWVVGWVEKSALAGNMQTGKNPVDLRTLVYTCKQIL